MGQVYNLQEKMPHQQGPTICLQCGNKGHAVAPIGTSFMECPKCGTMKEVFQYPIERDGVHWACKCENQLFRITPDGIYCPQCGEWQEGY
jgi:Zn finger protein HypA/HybF involved in hydrogenase expression